MINWQVRAGKGGVCDFRKNFEFYFKWLTNKVMSCFVISNEDQADERTRSINWDYAKMNLILNGEICITDFNDKLYACIGNLGGEPDEYYVPRRYLIANPILGSKEVWNGHDGVVIFNTKIDRFLWSGESCAFASGLYDLIEQTATLLADNIISINCSQINARVTTFFDADSESQAASGELVLKRMYAGKPYAILRGDLLEKIHVNPVNNSSSGQNITELVELHNYIVANFFQSIGIKSNNIMKRERLIRDEIESQDDFLQVSILEILSSWQDGLDKVNELYGTKFSVKLNPVLLNEMISQLNGEEAAAPAEKAAVPAEEAAAEPAASEPESEPEPEAADEDQEAVEPEEAAEPETETEPKEEAAPAEEAAAEPEDVKEKIENEERIVQDVLDLINDTPDEMEEGEQNVQPTEEAVESDTG